jgi:hypothetical protein
MFQVVVQLDPVTVPPNYVAGVSPYPDSWPEGTQDSDFGDGYHIVNVDDDQVSVIENNEFVYLALDGTLYGGTPG